MSEAIEEIKLELKSLCEEFNNILRKMEEQNIITYEEYVDYSSKKLEFLNR